MARRRNCIAIFQSTGCAVFDTWLSFTNCYVYVPIQRVPAGDLRLVLSVDDVSERAMTGVSPAVYVPTYIPCHDRQMLWFSSLELLSRKLPSAGWRQTMYEYIPISEESTRV